MPPIQDKIAIVTGISSGIGWSITEALVEAGMKVVGLSRRVAKMEDLAKSLERKKGTLYPIKCDITSAEDVKHAFEWVESTLGPVTVLINNAGVLKRDHISSVDLGDARSLFDTNVMGLIICSKEAMSSMKKYNTEGTIIHVNSVAGHITSPSSRLSCYMASKHAVTALTAGMRNEVTALNLNIRVTSLSPGVVTSEMTAYLPSDLALPSSDIAECVLFILKAPQRMNVSEMTVHLTSESMLTYAKYTVSVAGF